MSDFDNNEENTAENTIIELNSSEEETGAMDPDAVKEISETELKVKKMPKREDIHHKKSFKEKWHDLPKKAKIAIIVIPIIILVILVTILLLFFLVFRKDDSENEIPKETVTVEKDNYKYQDGSLIFLDEDDEEIGKYECKDKSVEKCFVANLSNEDDFDTTEYKNSKGEEITRPSKIFSKRFVFIFDDDKIVLYDMKDEESSGNYELIKTGNIDKNYVVVKEKDKGYGLLSFNAKSYDELISPSYDYLGIIDSDSVLVAKKEGKSFLVNTSDEAISVGINGDIRKFDDKYISGYNEGKYILYDYKGNALIIDDTIEYIDFQDGFIFTIKDGRIYPYDATLYKLTETGYKLKAKEYRPIYVFDDKNNYKETKNAYKITTSEGQITINIDGKDRNINIYEGLLSKQLPYVNYFDGSLFFYSDIEKTDLIGSYTCTNKNVVTKDSTTLTNCYIAQADNIVNNLELVGYIPIINKKYVFIKDANPDSKDGSRIVVTDIENAKVLGTYQKVDVTKRTADITHIDSLGEYIYAQNTSGKYGVIEISGNDATKKLDFYYNKISIFKNNYLLVQDDYYRLFSLDDLNEENEIIRSKNPIIDYSYGNFVVNKSNKYYVYNDQGKIVISDFDYVKLESDFIIGVKSNKLNLYKYNHADDEDPIAILKEEIDVTSTKYTDITVVSDNGYTITVKGSDGKEVVYKYDHQGKKVSNSEPTPEGTKPNEGDNSSEEE